MTDHTMHLQGWAKQMRGSTTRKPSKKELAEKAKRIADFERRADAAIEWAKARGL